jgi:hypothetical protein
MDAPRIAPDLVLQIYQVGLDLFERGNLSLHHGVECRRADVRSCSLGGGLLSAATPTPSEIFFFFPFSQAWRQQGFALSTTLSGTLSPTF